ncbi:hypothetical protein JL721_3707 [Aureococcus anophagefferens]|nr:hypothetical protein JL721_3707 [Aureococcus anophagefferens]
MRFYAMVALLAAPAHPLAQRRLLGATKKKKKVKKQPPLPTLPQNAPPPPRPAVTPEVHMAIVEAAVAARAPAIRDALGAGSFFAAEDFLDPAAVAAMAGEARGLDATLVPSQSTRWDGTRTVAYDKAGALGGAVNAGPSLRKLSEQEQTNKLAVCDAVAAAYPKHIDNGGGDDPRLLTTILYLAGCPAGGEFRAYAPTEDRVVESVTPAPGSFVCFWSDRLVHGVAEASSDGAAMAAPPLIASDIGIGSVEIDASDVVRLVLQFLKEHGLSSSAAELEREWDAVLPALASVELPAEAAAAVHEHACYELCEAGEGVARELLRHKTLQKLRGAEPERFLRLERAVGRAAATGGYGGEAPWPRGEAREPRASRTTSPAPSAPSRRAAS